MVLGDNKTLKQWVSAPYDSVSFDRGMIMGVWLGLNETVEWHFAYDIKGNRKVIGYNIVNKVLEDHNEQ